MISTILGLPRPLNSLTLFTLNILVTPDRCTLTYASNSSFVTAVANDYGFDNIYSRMVEAAGRNGDIFIGISTSGNSPNVVNAIDKANKIGMTTIGFTGKDGGKMKGMCDIMIQIPSTDTPRIQESHILVGHIICQIVEEELFGSK